MIEKDIKIYLHAIDNNLVCPKKQKKVILEDIAASIRDYIEDENITDISQLYSHFGSAEEIAKTYLADFVTPADIKKAVNKKKALIIGVIVALIIYVLALIIVIVDGHISVNGYIVESAPQEILIDTINLFDRRILL